tara:strand:+ start:42 stop:464 length:423 start_codon:yes stop_codon:yes gene_type:complete
MAIIGGGPGGGGPLGSGNSFTGTSQQLSLVGDHCYAYSGSSDMTGSFIEMFNFVTGNFYAVVELQMTADWDGMGSDQVFFDVYLGGTKVMDERANINLAGNPPGLAGPVRIIIPAYTEFKLEISCASGKAGAILTGEIYR